MKKIIGLLSLIALMLTGCSVKELEDLQDNVGTFPIFYASFDDNSEAETKTYVDDKLKLRWTKDDKLSIFAGNTYNHEYKYDGETGANNGTLSAVTSPEFVVGEILEANYAVYPYNVSNEMTADGSMSVVLPSVQKYAENSFGLGANTMVAVTEDKNDMLLQFKNLCGFIVIKLYGEGTVTSIKLEGNDGEKISGKASAQAAFGMLPSVTMSEEANTSITLDCGEGITLGTTAETATEFWFCVPPVTFSKGFTVTATKNDGWQMIQSSTSSKEVIRNTKNALTPIEAVYNVPSAGVVPPDDEIWYTTRDDKIIDLELTVQYNNSKPFDVNVISNTYINGKGIIKCDGPIKVINQNAFGTIMIGTTIYPSISHIILPDCVETIKESAFQNADIAHFRLPNELKHIESWALSSPSLEKFYGKNTSEDGRCVIIDNTLYAFAPYGISEYTIPEGVKQIESGSFRFNRLRVINIPEGVESIAGAAFESLDKKFFPQYHSSLEYIYIPTSMKFIDHWAFMYNDKIKHFYGDSEFVSADGMCLLDEEKVIITFASGAGLEEYSIPDGVKFTDQLAFYGALSLKRLNLPDTFMGMEAANLGISNIEKITGKYVLEDNRSMVIDGKLVMYAGAGQEKYVTPKEVRRLSPVLGFNTSIKEYILSDEIVVGEGCMFPNCPNLETVTISANMEYVGDDPFLSSELPKLKTVYCRALLPPIVYFNYEIDNPEYQFKDLTIFVPEQSVELYKQSWICYKDYIQGYKYEDLPKTDYYISTDYSADGTVHIIQTATVGNGVNVVLMGDAFSDRQIADGTYNNVMQKAMNALFGEEPYKSYKDYFNVYAVDAVSMTEGYGHGGQIFSTIHGDGTAVYGNDNKVFEYAQKALTAEQMDDALIIVMMNEDAYAGTCYMYYPNSGDYGDYGRGPSISYFPTSSDTETFNGIVSHEAGGHGFAKLADEYAYEYMGTISNEAISHTKQSEPYGWWKNVDFTSDPTQAKWSRLLNDERYANEGLGCFEGGLTYWSGVWRPTDNSIMRYNTGGFNAPSREAIWYRIHKLAYGEDWEYNYEDFVAYDAINRTPAAQAASRAKVKAAAAARKGKLLQPLHEPVVIKRSWKEAVNNTNNNGR